MSRVPVCGRHGPPIRSSALLTPLSADSYHRETEHGWRAEPDGGTSTCLCSWVSDDGGLGKAKASGDYSLRESLIGTRGSARTCDSRPIVLILGHRDLLLTTTSMLSREELKRMKRTELQRLSKVCSDVLFNIFFAYSFGRRTVSGPT